MSRQLGSEFAAFDLLIGRMHFGRIVTKTIRITLDAYDRLKAAKLHEKETFSSVVRRAVWPAQPMSGKAIVAYLRARPAFLSEAELTNIEAAERSGTPSKVI